MGGGFCRQLPPPSRVARPGWKSDRRSPQAVAVPRPDPAEMRIGETTLPRGRLDMFLAPESIAVIGASDDPSRIGGRTIFNLKRGGFAGPIYPINPGRAVVQGLPAYSSIGGVAERIDCAIIALPGELVIA